MRPLSTRSPSIESIAGSTVIEPRIATATMIIVPTANDVKISEPLKNIPDIAISTVSPEMRTVWPDVADVLRSASLCE